MFLLPSLGFYFIFYNLPLFISELSWIATHNLCLDCYKVTKQHSIAQLIINTLYQIYNIKLLLKKIV
jgi:hypothetical protein